MRIDSDEYEILMAYTVESLERLFTLAAIIYRQYQQIYSQTDFIFKDELEIQYINKVKETLCLDIGEGTRLNPQIVLEFVEEILYLFIEDVDKY